MLRSLVLSTQLIILIGSVPQNLFSNRKYASSLGESRPGLFENFNFNSQNGFLSHPSSSFGSNSFLGSSSFSIFNRYGGASDKLDFIGETRRQTEELKATLRMLARNPTASKYTNRVFSSGGCIRNMEEAIAIIEQGTETIEKAEPQLRKLLDINDRFSNTQDIIEATKVTADIMKELEYIFQGFTPIKSGCGATSSSVSAALHNVAALIDEISDDRSLNLPRTGQLQLKASSEVVTTFTNFMAKIVESTKNICTAGNKYSTRPIGSMSEMLEDMADLFFNLGDFQSAQKIRESGPIIEEIQKALSSVPSFGTSGNICESPQDFRGTASMMEDLANLLQELGLENIQKMGISSFFDKKY